MMPVDSNSAKPVDVNLNPCQAEAIKNIHTAFLEALRHREQEILSYLAILVPALGGFVWLLSTPAKAASTTDHAVSNQVFAFGTIGVIGLLLIGALYALSLGYNYRYITVQLAKLECDKCLDIRSHILEKWRMSPQELIEKLKWRGKAWCTPPEIIKTFWIAFVTGIIAVTIMACAARSVLWVFLTVVPAGVLCAAVAGMLPRHFGRKLQSIIEKEVGKWGDPPVPTASS